MTINKQKNKYFNILISGFGKIGHRHLESLLKVKDILINIEIYDIRPINIDKKLKNNSNIKVKKLRKFPKNRKYFLTILSMNSDNRFHFFERFINYNMCKNILSEKIIFNSLIELDKAGKLIDKYKINFWVNCNKRITKVYNYIKMISKNSELKNISIIGNDWGLACNLIHYLDYFCWINNSRDLKFYKNFLINKIYKSKRNNYIEFYGSLKFTINNSFLNVNCKLSKDKKIIIKHEFDKKIIYLDEILQELKIIDKKTRKTTLKKFINNKVSISTKYFFLNLYKSKKINLSDYNESTIYHKIMLKEFFDFYKKNTKLRAKKIMIT